MLSSLAFFAGAAAFFLQGSGRWASPGGLPAVFSYACGVLLILCGIALRVAAPAAPRTAADAANWAAPADPGPEIEALVRADEVIPAIKRHREQFGSSLKEAKDAVDAIRSRLRKSGEI